MSHTLQKIDVFKGNHVSKISYDQQYMCGHLNLHRHYIMHSPSNFYQKLLKKKWETSPFSLINRLNLVKGHHKWGHLYPQFLPIQEQVLTIIIQFFVPLYLLSYNQGPGQCGCDGCSCTHLFWAMGACNCQFLGQILLSNFLSDFSC